MKASTFLGYMLIALALSMFFVGQYLAVEGPDWLQQADVDRIFEKKVHSKDGWIKYDSYISGQYNPVVIWQCLLWGLGLFAAGVWIVYRTTKVPSY